MEDALVEKLNSSVVRGLTLLGGEPLDPSNQPGVLKLLRKVKKQCPGKDIWCYTGYVWEKDVWGWMSEQCPETKEILSFVLSTYILSMKVVAFASTASLSST